MYNYEKNLWGIGSANLNWSDPTAFRLKLSLKSLPKTGKVLELGCGAGQFIRGIKKIKSDLNCYGCDISWSAIQKAKSFEDKINYKISEENSLPYDDDLFDTVLIYDVLEHVENPNAILEEVNRILKPNGTFYMFVPCEGDWLSFWNLLKKFGLGIGLTKKYAGHINYFTRTEIYDLLNKNGFNIIQKRFSEHFLGQKLGLLSFFLMDRYSKKFGLKQLNNEEYFKKVKFSSVKKIVNSLVYFESWVLQLIPSPNVHFLSIKSKSKK